MGIPGFSKVMNNLKQQSDEQFNDPNKLFNELYNNILPNNKHLILREMLESTALCQLGSSGIDMFSIIILNESVECFFVLIEKGFKVQYCSTIFSIMARELRGTKIFPILIERDEFPDKENILDFMIEEVRKSWFIFPKDDRVQSYINKLNEFKNKLSFKEQKEMNELEQNGKGYISKDRGRLILERQKSMEILKQMQQIGQIQQIEQNHSRDQLQNQMQNQRQELRNQYNDTNNDDNLKRKNNDNGMEY